MTPRTIHPRELAPGAHVAIVDLTAPSGWTPASDSPLQHMVTAQCSQPSLIGHPLEVLSIDLPFVLVLHPSGQKFSIDARRHQFMLVSAEYWSAYAGTSRRSEGDCDFDQLVEAHNKLAELVARLARDAQPTPPAAPVWRALLPRLEPRLVGYALLLAAVVVVLLYA